MRKLCKFCRKQYNAKHSYNKFCNRYCAVRGRPGIHKRNKRFEKICFFCKNIYRVKQKSKKTAGKFCSRKCYAKYQINSIKGKNNPNWKGGISRRTNGVSGINKNYLKGRYYENKTRKRLEKQGYYVMRSGGSLGIIDLIAFNNSSIKLIQVKSGSSPFTKENKDKFTKLIIPSNAIKELWQWQSQKEPTIKIIPNSYD